MKKLDWRRGKYPPDAVEAEALQRAFDAARELVLSRSGLDSLPLPERRKARLKLLRSLCGSYPCPALAGSVVLGSRGVDKLKSSKEDPLTNDALMEIGRLLKQAEFAYARPDESRDVNLRDVVRLVCRVRVKDCVAAIKLTVKRYAQDEEVPRLYALEVVGMDPAV